MHAITHTHTCIVIYIHVSTHTQACMKKLTPTRINQQSTKVDHVHRHTEACKIHSNPWLSMKCWWRCFYEFISVWWSGLDVNLTFMTAKPGCSPFIGPQAPSTTWPWPSHRYQSLPQGGQACPSYRNTQPPPTPTSPNTHTLLLLSIWTWHCAELIKASMCWLRLQQDDSFGWEILSG